MLPTPCMRIQKAKRSRKTSPPVRLMFFSNSVFLGKLFKLFGNLWVGLFYPTQAFFKPVLLYEFSRFCVCLPLFTQGRKTFPGSRQIFGGNLATAVTVFFAGVVAMASDASRGVDVGREPVAKQTKIARMLPIANVAMLYKKCVSFNIQLLLAACSPLQECR